MDNSRVNNNSYGSAQPGKSMDCGPDPYVVNISRAAKNNPAYRATIWTGDYLQITLMSIPPCGGEIGLESHPHLDQFLRIESGCGVVKMGPCKDSVTLQRPVGPGDAVVIPAGTWHNLINTGRSPVKLYSIYAPPQHPKGTYHPTKADADREEMHH